MIPKFRAWDKKHKQMIKIISLNWYEHIIDYNVVGIFPNTESVARFWDETIVMQSTGLKDKNDVEIYDGDIVVNHVGDVWVIIYFRGAFRYYPIESFSKEEEKQFETDNIGNFDTEAFEVLGNVYENSELLEELE